MFDRKGAMMPNRTRTPLKLLVLTLLALPLALLSQNLFAAEEGSAPDLAAFLGSLADPSVPGEESFTPAPENRAGSCILACAPGQRCLYCNQSWVCIWVYPDNPNRIPPGCSTGGPL
jgi:hypothetical protein